MQLHILVAPYDSALRGFRWLCPLLLLLSCSRPPAPEEAQSGSALPSVDPSTPASTLPLREEFVQHGLRVPGTSRAAFAQAFGEPDSTTARVIPNRHVPDAQDTLFTLYYPGLVAHVHRPGPGGELLSSVEVTENRYLRYPAIAATRGSVEEAFGAPDEQTSSSVTYYCTRCVADNDPVQFFFESGRVHRIRFNYYVD